ncbi:MAG: sigma-54-dependent Fis family transcriptional regulator [Deltaproteobacteria bacterium]|nr:sigma-54-dependent Fis family transcriptional regulator [Candidatus Anaeroferrophillus wilburensis]MBN2888820.1 sigma-54-dependent Fis family transcriptional regulator [Deltaproteobacteria bacterium]
MTGAPGDGRILLVDDDPTILEVLKIRLESIGYRVADCGTPHEALKLFRGEPFDLVITDLKMEGMDGLALMKEVLAINSDMPVLILTAHGTIDNAVTAMREGAYGYITKPFQTEELAIQVKNAIEKSHLRAEITRLQQMLERERKKQSPIISTSPAMQKVIKTIQAISNTNSTVTILGESGTGKELVAREIHYLSPRAEQPFVPLNCGAIPETLLESELFGYTKGAFTGAAKNHAGIFERANGGTIFLDEITETSPSFQVKLLRVLQERSVFPLGSKEEVPVDIRIIAATNQDLEQLVAAGKFREDLYYRIYVIPLSLPPLRERQEDIPLLAQHFLDQYRQELKKEVVGFHQKTLQQMMVYQWPGNVRELENKVQYALAVASGDVITPEEMFPASQSRPNLPATTMNDAKKQFERDYIINVLNITKGNVSQAAQLAGRHRVDFYNLIKKHQIDVALFREKSGP